MTSSKYCPEGFENNSYYDFYEVFPRNGQIDTIPYTLLSTEGECQPNGSENEASLGSFYDTQSCYVACLN